MDQLRLDGQVAVVTGAGRGLGRAVASAGDVGTKAGAGVVRETVEVDDAGVVDDDVDPAESIQSSSDD